MKGQKKHMTLIEITHFIEETITTIQAHPEDHVSDIGGILELLKHDNLIIVQMSIMALTDLFIDIAPLYRIDEQAHDQKLQKFIKKEEKYVLQFEMNLTQYYKQFIHSQFAFTKMNGNDQVKNLIITCYESFGKLLLSLFHFNYSKDIVQYLVYGLLTQNSICYSPLASILSNKKHSLHDTKIHILSQIQKLIQTKYEDQLPDNLIELVNNLKIDTKFLSHELEKQEKEKKREVKKKKREFFSQKQKDKKKQKNNKEAFAQQKKLLKEVQDELQEAQGDVDKKTIAKNNGEILSKVFYIYFKILKAQKTSKYFESCLNGILQYVHLINIELIQGIFDCLQEATKLLRQGKKKVQQDKTLTLRLKTVFTLQSIIDGPASVFEIDDKETMAKFYTCLQDIKTNTKLTIDDEGLILQLLDTSLIKKRHFSQEVAGSFIKVLAKIATNSQNYKFIYALCYCIKLLTQKYQRTQKMIEEENEGYGLNSYNEKCEDPSSTNALNSSIYSELNTIKNKGYDQKLLSLISKILKGEPIPQHMLNKGVFDVYKW